MKAREFWLYETGFSEGDGYSEYAVTETIPEENIKDHIHTREVISIDWDKAYQQFHDWNSRGRNISPDDWKKIQELVEKQLKGE